MKTIEKIECPICRGSKVAQIGKPQISAVAQRFIRKDYLVVECKPCKFYFVHPTIDFTQTEWTDLCGDCYFGEVSGWWENKKQEFRNQRLANMEKYCKNEIDKFLDIGCGEGYTLTIALKRGWDVHGIDISDNRIEAAKNKKIKFLNKNIYKASFPDNCFDAIYVDSVLEHILEPQKMMLEINRILKIGGIIYVGVPNENSLFNDFRKLVFTMMGRYKLSSRIKPFKMPYHVIGFTQESLRSILSANKFKIARLNNFSGLNDWRKFKLFTRRFLIHSSLIPLHLAAIPLKKRSYLDVYAVKSQ